MESRDAASQRAEVEYFYCATDILEIKELKTEGSQGAKNIYGVCLLCISGFQHATKMQE